MKQRDIRDEGPIGARARRGTAIGLYVRVTCSSRSRRRCASPPRRRPKGWRACAVLLPSAYVQARQQTSS